MISLQNTNSKRCADRTLCNLRLDIEASLRSSSFAQIRNLVCECHGTVVVLRGQVDSYYHKQVAQELVKKVDRHLIIANLVIVT